MQGQFGEWIRKGLGLDPGSMYPSVRTALETALLTALAATKGETLAELLCTNPSSGPMDAVPVNALLDCRGTPEECAAAAVELVGRGFSCIKVKVRGGTSRGKRRVWFFRLFYPFS